jgi:hypothetical protein
VRENHATADYLMISVRRPGRTFSIIRPGHLQREPSGIVEPPFGNRATLLSRARFKFGLYSLDVGETEARNCAAGKRLVWVQESLGSLFDMIGLGKQQVCGISQPRDAVDHKGSLERQPINWQHIGQIAQELRRIDFAQARCDGGIHGLFGTSKPSGANVYNVHRKVLLRSAAQRRA